MQSTGVNDMVEGILYYHEVFLSVQGESTDAGKPCVFIRLYGCNAKCTYCDQPQTKKDKHKISVEHLVQEAMKYGCKNVCITGGEPMLQNESVYQLALELVSDYDCNVSIETNGCVLIPPDLYYPSRLKFVMDVKCPSSGVSHLNVYENLMTLRPRDEVKFVVGSRNDYEFMKKVLKTYPTPAKVLVSPVFNYSYGDYSSPISHDLVKWLLEDKLFNVRVQIQMHKCLGVS